VAFDLKHTLSRLREIEDPGWESAIADFARAEVKHHDPGIAGPLSVTGSSPL
jgi:hypothetical protein